MSSPQTKTRSEKHTRELVARLHAVQGVYGNMFVGDHVKLVVNDFLTRQTRDGQGMDVEGEFLAPPDKALLSAILQGVEEKLEDLQGMISSAHTSEKDVEPLLKSILLCGAYEIQGNPDTDSGVIMNDYLDIAHAFYSQTEVGLVNGILDKLIKINTLEYINNIISYM